MTAPTTQPSIDLTGRVALVTGGTRGIGLAIARALARAGARLVVSSRKREAVDQVTTELRDAGHDATPIPAHRGHVEEARSLDDRAVEHYGALDIVVNNAATNPVYGPIAEASDELFDKIMAVNVKGPFEIAKRALPHLAARGRGSIINIASIGGISPEPGLGVYSVSKAALISLTKALAKEWGAQGVRVNAIAPGFIRTHFSSALWTNDEVMRTVLARTPLPRIAEPEEVASLALFLASDAASFCTGAVYMADGGYLA
jgi:NAD(P)-dependent dehydrogenase (short-subunit alcohol dehydrogenase family)